METWNIGIFFLVRNLIFSVSGVCRKGDKGVVYDRHHNRRSQLLIYVSHRTTQIKRKLSNEKKKMREKMDNTPRHEQK